MAAAARQHHANRVASDVPRQPLQVLLSLEAERVVTRDVRAFRAEPR